MKKLIALFTLFSVSSIHAECVHEFATSGLDLMSRESTKALFVDVGNDGRFLPLNEVVKKLNSLTTYQVQKQLRTDKALGYDDRYIKYYHYSRVLEFLQEYQTRFEQNDYIVETVGHSL